MLGLAREGHITPERVRARTPPGAALREPLSPSTMIPFGEPTLRILKRVAAAAGASPGEISAAHLLREVLR
jgi:hypothetical protein